MASARHGKVSLHVDAPPEKVWSVVANLDRMGEWSPECYRVAWLDVEWLPPSARFFEDVLMFNRDRQREAAMRTTLERIKSAAEAAG